jgi:hypothetical protein
LIESDGLAWRREGLCAQPVTSCSTPSAAPVDLRSNSHRAQSVLSPDNFKWPVPLHNLPIPDGTNPGEWLCYNRNPFRTPCCPSCTVLRQHGCQSVRPSTGRAREPGRECAVPRSRGNPGEESGLCRMNRLGHNRNPSPGCSPTEGSGDTQPAMRGRGTRQGDPEWNPSPAGWVPSILVSIIPATAPL